MFNFDIKHIVEEIKKKSFIKSAPVLGECPIRIQVFSFRSDPDGSFFSKVCTGEYSYVQEFFNHFYIVSLHFLDIQYATGSKAHVG